MNQLLNRYLIIESAVFKLETRKAAALNLMFYISGRLSLHYIFYI